MTIHDAALHVAEALNTANIPYMLVGSFSSNYYGIARSTQDADFVIQTATSLDASFAHVLGAHFEAEPQMSFETNTWTQRQEFRIRGGLFKVKFFRLSDDPHDLERFARRQPVQLRGKTVFLPTAEDVVIWKLRWARAKDREDVRAVISVQQDRLDWLYIESWCLQHGTRDLLSEIRCTVPTL